MFASLLKDTEAHSSNKTLSAYVAILETVDQNIGLKYQASTPYDSNFILGKIILRTDSNVTFDVIDTGRSVKIESVQNSNKKIHFFNSGNQKDGTLLICPLKYSRNKTFGTLGIDSLQEKSKDLQQFSDTEVLYYQVSNLIK